MVNPDLIEAIRKEFRLDWFGVHGVRHFQRVMDNGLRLSEETNANETVVELFAFLHDARRYNECDDKLHGKRAAKTVLQFQGIFFDLPPEDLELLAYTCEFHTSGLLEGNVTVQTCWDADRLDLGRVGIKPIPRKLCTVAAKKPEMIEWAYRRSLSR